MIGIPKYTKVYQSILIVFLLVLSSVIVSSQGLLTQTNANTNIGYDIRFPEYTTARVNTSFTLHTHVYNRSTGLLLDNSTVACFLHLYDPMGSAIFEKKLGYDKGTNPMGEFTLNISEGNFSSFGVYAYVIQCNSTVFGGFASGLYEVNGSGFELDGSKVAVYYLLVIILILLLVALIFISSKLPSGNVRSDDGRVIQVSYLKYLRPVFLGIGYLLVMAILYIVYSINEAYLLGSFGSLLLSIFMIMGFSGIVMIIILFFKIIDDIMNDQKIKRMLERGIDIDD